MKTNLILGTALLIIAGNLNAADLRVKGGFLPGGIIDDRKLLSEINLKTIELRDAKDGAVKSAELLKQLKKLDRKKCDIQLATAGKQRLTAAETAARAQRRARRFRPLQMQALPQVAQRRRQRFHAH
jgi:hypothetical protein